MNFGDRLAADSIPVEGNEPILLDHADTLWLVESGLVAVYAANEHGKGERRLLFTVAGGQLLVPAATGNRETDMRLVAVALEPVRLLPGSRRELAHALAGGDHQALSLLERWIRNLGSAIEAEGDSPVTVNVDGAQSVALRPGERIGPQPAQVVWIKVERGAVCFLGVPELLLTSAHGIYPLGGGTWLQATEETSLVLQPSGAIQDENACLSGLDLLGTYFMRSLEMGDKGRKIAEEERFLRRQWLDAQATRSAVARLAALVSPVREEPTVSDGTPLVAAVRAVAGALGMEVRVPEGSGKGDRDDLQRVLRASGIRSRRTTLPPDWWTKDAGPLLGYLSPEQRPVALLRDRRGRGYEIRDFAEMRRIPVDRETAQTLVPVAHTLYPSLPARADLRAAVRFALRGQAHEAWVVMLSGLAATLVGMAVPLLTAVLIDMAIPDADRRVMLQVAFGLVAATLGATIFRAAQTLNSLRLEVAGASTLQAAVWDRLMRVPTSFFRQFTTGDLHARANAVSEIQRNLSGSTLNALFTGFASLLNLGLMFYFNSTLAVLGLAITLVALFLTSTCAYRASALIPRLQKEEGELTGLVVQLINAVPKLRVAGAEQRAFARWAREYGEKQKLVDRLRGLQDTVAISNGVLPAVSLAVVFPLAADAVRRAQEGLADGMALGSFLAFSAAFGMVLAGVVTVGETSQSLVTVTSLWRRARSILDAETEQSSSDADPGVLTGRFSIDHVTFRYRADGPLTLDDVSIEAGAGECIALVGPSGSGKSSILNLLLGFEAPLIGTVYLDGQDLSGLNCEAVRRQMGVVLQENRLIAGPIFYNIAGSSVCTMEEAWEAARHAAFAEDIEQMPMGMFTMVSEGGSNLSGGQRQRLLLARALVSKPRILILDEATSALDNRTQAIVSENLKRLRITRLLVAHRLSTVRHADSIYVIQGGRVLQKGTFNELASQPGLFAQLMARQMA
ncbi:MAG TPA: NHLP bacteriocin export ABC transporter permease/ATPase subunit [Terriglobales bacterium]|nr:NHLP bacteriocin export ABC transporter permease/ATPase subunit [Terriglobales bacterium]